MAGGRGAMASPKIQISDFGEILRFRRKTTDFVFHPISLTFSFIFSFCASLSVRKFSYEVFLGTAYSLHNKVDIKQVAINI